ncbi:MAG: hypothetical protein AB7F89_19615 [Pirellulaceae bacterium]
MSPIVPCVAAALTLAGCSINGVGVAYSDVIPVTGARAVLTETYGVAVRTVADDAGVTIGYSWTLTLLPECAAAPLAGKHRFGVSTAGIPAIAAVRRTAGLAIDTNRRAVGLMLGFAEDAMLGRLMADESVRRRLVLTPDDLSTIEFNQIPEPPCG